MSIRSAAIVGASRDRVCFEGILVRLVTGSGWVDVEALMGNRVSDTTLRDRRDQWIRAGVFDRLADEAVVGYDRVVGLDLSECSVDGSQQKAPLGGEGTGPTPSIEGNGAGSGRCSPIDHNGIPLGWAGDGANRNDCVMLEPTLDAVAERGLLVDCETLHLDRGYDNGVVRDVVAGAGIADLVCSKVRRHWQGKEGRAAGLALARRAHQQLAVQLRPATAQHRPPFDTPAGPTRPGRHASAHC